MHQFTQRGIILCVTPTSNVADLSMYKSIYHLKKRLAESDWRDAFLIVNCESTKKKREANEFQKLDLDDLLYLLENNHKALFFGDVWVGL